MALVKISALPLTASVADNDYFPVVDAAATTTSRVLLSSLLTSRAALTGANFTGPVTASLGISGSHGSFGTAPVATTGAVRLANAAAIKARNSSNTLDTNTISGGDNVVIGEATNNSYVAIRSNISIYNQINGIDKFTINPTQITAEVPIIVGSSATIASDAIAYFSGSCGLTGSASNRKAFTFAGDIMFSGSVQENRPTLAPKSRYWQFSSQSITTGSNPTVAFDWQIMSGAMSIDALVTATSVDVGAVATFRKLALLNRQVNTFAQVGPVGGTSAGSLTSSNASTWGMAIDNLAGVGRLVLTGSAATTVNWSWTVFVNEVSP